VGSPPDPSWITGIYDFRDFDDVVSYLTGGMVGIPALPVVYQVEFLPCVPPIPARSQSLGVYFSRPLATRTTPRLA